MKLLRKLEWSGVQHGPGNGPMFSGGDGDRVAACPLCHGINPKDKGRDNFIKSAHGHRVGCEIVEILK